MGGSWSFPEGNGKKQGTKTEGEGFIPKKKKVSVDLTESSKGEKEVQCLTGKILHLLAFPARLFLLQGKHFASKATLRNPLQGKFLQCVPEVRKEL